MGHSQVRKVSKHDAKSKVATMQKSNGMESLDNVQSEPIKVRWDYGEGELDYTLYDYQTNWSNINRTIVWPDGKVNFAYNIAFSESLSDCGTGIGTYDSNFDEWIPSDGRIETEKTCFGSIARYQENSIVVAAQTEYMCKLYIVEDKDNITPNSVPPVSYLNPSYDPRCPNVMTSGANRDIIHVVATANSDFGVPGAEGVNMPIIYFRSMDGGETWDKENIVLPYMGPEYGVAWGNHICYWMETTEDNCLALVVNNPWSDGMVIYSYDDGETWERKVFYHHPGINTTFDTWFMYPRWISCVWGANDELCLAYEFNCNTGEPGSRNYDPSIGGVAFWSESLPYHGETPPPTPGQPFVMNTDYILELYNSWYNSFSNYYNWYNPLQEIWTEFFGYIDEGDTLFLGLHGDYNCGPVAMPVLCKVPNTDDDLIAVWIALDENNIDGSGNYYYKLFGSYSPNGGLQWFPKIHLSDDFMWTLNEFVYPQAAVIGSTLVVAVQTDSETGTFIQDDDPDGGNNFYQGFTFDISGFIPPVPPSPHPNNSEWYYEIEWDNGDITYQHLECIGDTVMQGKRPKVIVRSNTHYDRDTIIEVTHEYIYEENGIVYWWNKDLQEFTTLYNLNANAGDEWEIKVGTESLTMHVDAVENYEYEGYTYRMLTVSDPEDLFSGDIVCGIGHLTSFFPERLMNRDKNYSVEGIRCYWVDGNLIFKIDEEDCDAVYNELHGVEENGPSAGLGTFVVYPNPTNGVLTIQHSSFSIHHSAFRITNLMGQTVLSGNINAETQQIDIANLPAGMYFINVGEQTAKFVKQ
jgi:hypothetical protein